MDSVTLLHIPWIFKLTLTRSQEIRNLGCELFKVLFFRVSFYEDATLNSLTFGCGIGALELTVSFMVHNDNIRHYRSREEGWVSHPANGREALW